MSSKLASLLVQEGRVNARRMADVFQRQVIHGGTLDTILLELGLVDENILAETLGRALGLPVAPEASPEDVLAEARDAVEHGFSALVAERFRSLPLGFGGGRLRVMVIDPPEPQDLVDLAEALGVTLEPQISLEYRFQQLQATLFDLPVPARYTTLVNKLRSRVRTATTAAVVTPAVIATPAARVEAAPARTDDKITIAQPAPTTRSPSTASPAAPGASTTAPSTNPSMRRPQSITATQRLTPTSAHEASSSALAAGASATAAPVRAPTKARAETVDIVRPNLRAPAAPAPSVDDSWGTPTPGPRPAPARPPIDRKPQEPDAAPFQLAKPKAVERPTLIIRKAKGFGEEGEGGAGHPIGGSPAASASPVLEAPFSAATPQSKVSPIAAPASAAPAAASAASAPTSSLGLAEGIAALQQAPDRDAIFETLCRIARDRCSFVAVFTIQNDVATARQALGSSWWLRASLAHVSVDLTVPSPMRTAVQTCAPFIGKLGDEPVLAEALRAMGRPAPLAAALVAVALKDRAVAVLYADDSGEQLASEELPQLAQAAAEASKAFLRLIQAAKKKGAADLQAASPAAAAASGETSLDSGRVAAAALAPASIAAAAPSRQPGAAARAGGVAPAIARPAATSVATQDSSTLLGQVEREEPTADAAAAALVGRGAAAAELVAASLPGPLRFGHRKLHTLGLALAEHGPLVALGAAFGSAIVPYLIARLDEADADVRFYIALILGELRPREAIEGLGRHLFDNDAPVRRACSHSLIRFEPSTAMERLLEALRTELLSPHLMRQRCAIAALGELRDVASTPKLIDLLRHRDAEVADVAEHALVLIAKQDFATSRWKWRSWWEKARSQSRIEWLVAGLDQTSEEARRSAMEELESIGGDRFGFHATFSPREREWAARRWTAWLKQHPEVEGGGS